MHFPEHVVYVTEIQKITENCVSALSNCMSWLMFNGKDPRAPQVQETESPEHYNSHSFMAFLQEGSVS